MSWDPVEDIEPTPSRYRQLPDGRQMAESRITVSREMIEQMWQGYRCAACLEDVSHLGPFPERCPNAWCDFPIRERQRQQLEIDFVGEIEEARRDGWIDNELGFLERQFFQPKPQIHVPRAVDDKGHKAR